LKTSDVSGILESEDFADKLAHSDDSELSDTDVCSDSDRHCDKNLAVTSLISILLWYHLVKNLYVIVAMG
jgi:hypothetical protein